ncbi:MAG TPA: glycine cleavage system protein GcvH [Jiangellaceae bacterium]
MYPEDLRYTAEHEWVRTLDEPAGAVRVGVTDYAQDQLGDIVFVQLPDVGEEVTAGQACGELESTKSVSDLYAPVSGKVTARNDAVLDAPEKVNADPYGDGWLFDVVPSDAGAVDGLLSASEYQAEIS